MWEGLKTLLGGAGNKMENIGMENLAVLLGTAGSAISPQESWQQRLGAGAAELAAQEQTRRYLAELLGGEEEEPKTKSPKTPKPDRIEAPLTPTVLSMSPLRGGR